MNRLFLNCLFFPKMIPAALVLLMLLSGCGSKQPETASVVSDNRKAPAAGKIQQELSPASVNIEPLSSYKPVSKLNITPVKNVFETGELLEFIVEVPEGKAARRKLYIRGLDYADIPNRSGLHLTRLSSTSLLEGRHVAELVGRDGKGRPKREGVRCTFAIVTPPLGLAALPLEKLKRSKSGDELSTVVEIPQAAVPYSLVPVPFLKDLPAKDIQREWSAWLSRSFPRRQELAGLLGVKEFSLKNLRLPAEIDVHDPLFLTSMRFRDWFTARRWIIDSAARGDTAPDNIPGIKLPDTGFRGSAPGSLALAGDWFLLPEFDPVLAPMLASMPQHPRVVLQRRPQLLGFSRWQTFCEGVTDFWSDSAEDSLDASAMEYLRPVFGLGSRLFSPVAVLYSPASEAVTSAASEKGGTPEHTAAFRAWMLLLRDIGVFPRIVFPKDLAGGLPKEIRVLVLPRVVAMSRTERTAVLQFVAGGGMVMADSEPAVMDENGVPEHKRWSQRLFGYDDRFSRPADTPRRRRGRFIDPIKDAPTGYQGDSLLLRLDNVKAAGDAVAYVRSLEGGQACLVREFNGGGRTVYLNLDVMPYIAWREETAEKDFFPVGYVKDEMERIAGEAYGGAALRDLVRAMLMEQDASGPAAIRVERVFTESELHMTGSRCKPFRIPAEGIRLAAWSLDNGVLVMLCADSLKRPVSGKAFRLFAPRVVHWYDLTTGEYRAQASFLDVSIPSGGRPEILFLTGLKVYGLDGGIVGAVKEARRGGRPASVMLDVVTALDTGKSSSSGRRLVETVVADAAGRSISKRSWALLNDGAGSFKYRVFPSVIRKNSGCRLVVRDMLSGGGITLNLSGSGTHASVSPTGMAGKAVVEDIAISRDVATSIDGLKVSMSIRFKVAMAVEENFDIKLSLPAGFSVSGDTPLSGLSPTGRPPVVFGHDRCMTLRFKIVKNKSTPWPDSLPISGRMIGETTGAAWEFSAEAPLR